MIIPRELKRIRPGNVMVRNASLNMNSKREFVGAENTLQPLHTLSLNVTRYFTDVNGTILAKNDAGLVAAGMTQKYPVFMLGEFDKMSGYKIGQNIVPPKGIVKYYLTFVNGYGMTTNQIVTPFSGVNDVQQMIKLGDIVQVYTDNLLSPNYFCFIVLSGETTGLASLMGNLGTKQNDNRLMKLHCYEIRLITDFIQQLPEAWNYVYADNLGNFKSNQITYNMFNNPFNVLPDVLTVSTEFDFNQYIGIYLYMVLAVDKMSVNFNFKIIE